MSTTEIKAACPFCKSRTAFYDSDRDGGCVRCKECRATGPPRLMPSDGIADWNQCENDSEWSMEWPTKPGLYWYTNQSYVMPYVAAFKHTYLILVLWKDKSEKELVGRFMRADNLVDQSHPLSKLSEGGGWFRLVDIPALPIN